MHYYKDGKRWEPVKANGDPYLRIPRKVLDESGAVPGATDILSAFGNTWWMKGYFGDLGIESAIQAFERNPNITHVKGDWVESAEGILERLSNAPADRGTLIHWALERFANGEDYHTDDEVLRDIFRVAIKETEELIGQLFPTAIRSEAERQFSGKYYGGTQDRVFFDANGTRVGILDYKSIKEKRNPRIKECAQLVAYKNGDTTVVDGDKKYLIEDNPMLSLVNIYVDANTGHVLSHRVWTKEEQKGGWDLFQASLDAYTVFHKFGD